MPTEEMAFGAESSKNRSSSSWISAFLVSLRCFANVAVLTGVKRPEDFEQNL